MAKMANFGEKSWDDESASGGGGNDFFNMKDNGQYEVRLAGKPHEFAAHWIDAGGSKRKVNCAGEDCILCARDEKVSIRYFIPIILREGPGIDSSNAGTVVVTEFGPQVYGAIRNLYKMKNWGNPVNYDIVIDKNTKRGASGTYFVSPARKFPLTDQEKADVKEFLSNMDLKELSSPLDNDAIIQKLGPEICNALKLTVSNTPSSDENSTEEFQSFGEDGDSDFEWKSEG